MQTRYILVVAVTFIVPVIELKREGTKEKAVFSTSLPLLFLGRRPKPLESGGGLGHLDDPKLHFRVGAEKCGLPFFVTLISELLLAPAAPF